MLPQLVVGNVSATASEISRVLVSRYLLPYYSFVLADLLHTVGHELTIFALTVDPVQGYCRVQPAMHFRNFLDSNRCFNICYEIHRHMPCYEFRPWNSIAHLIPRHTLLPLVFSLKNFLIILKALLCVQKS